MLNSETSNDTASLSFGLTALITACVAGTVLWFDLPRISEPAGPP